MATASMMERSGDAATIAHRGVDTARRRYSANLGALYRSDPVLARRIDAHPFAESPELLETRDGRATARLIADDGQEIYAHSRYRPADEARQIVDAQPRHDNAAFVVAGCGLGYLLAALEESRERPFMVVGEDDLGLLKAALSTVDLATPLSQGRIVFLTSADKAEIHGKLMPASAHLMLGFQLLTHPHTTRCRAAFHTQLRGMIADFVAYCRLQTVTLLRNARITIQNIAYNLPAYLGHAGVEGLRGWAAGHPAIVVAAGPSLAAQLDALCAARDSAVIIAAQTVFKLLLAKGCEPHFVTSLDYHEISAQFFRGAGDVGACQLVAEPKATWHVLDAYPGVKRVLHSDVVDELLRSAAPRRGALKAGCTVAHLSFYLAQFLGCDPIILVGQDLCYSQGLYYPPGMPIEEVWRPELGRFQTMEMKQWERVVRSRPILRVVQDVHGRPAYTDDQLVTYAEQFQSDFAQCRARVIHAGEAGMCLSGATVMSLGEAVRQFCARRLPELRPNDERDVDPKSVSRALQELDARIVELSAMREIAREMSTLLERLLGLLDRPGEFNRALVRVDALRTAMQQYDRTYRLVVQVSQTAELRRLTADMRLDGVVEENADTARRRLLRDRDFVQSFADGCEFLLGILPEAKARLRGAPE